MHQLDFAASSMELRDQRRRLYIQEVGKIGLLFDPHLQQIRAEIPQLRGSVRRAMQAAGMKRPQFVSETSEAGDRGRCSLCRSRVRQKCSSCHKFVCKIHQKSTEIVCDNC